MVHASSTTVVYDDCMSRIDAQLKIRLPEDLKARIEEAAKANGRSMNAEIVARLEASLQHTPQDEVSLMQELLQALREHPRSPKGQKKD